MDLHALSLGRSMMLVRGGIAFLVGVIASNQQGISATSLAVIWGLWALAEGAATIRQGYPPSGTSRRAEARPVMLVMGGVAVGGRAAGRGGTRPVGRRRDVAAGRMVRRPRRSSRPWVRPPRARRRALLLGAAALVDIGLVAVFVTHTSGSVVDLALFGGGLALIWGLSTWPRAGHGPGARLDCRGTPSAGPSVRRLAVVASPSRCRSRPSASGPS